VEKLETMKEGKICKIVKFAKLFLSHLLKRKIIIIAFSRRGANIIKKEKKNIKNVKRCFQSQK
jgi:hypothetical protein